MAKGSRCLRYQGGIRWLTQLGLSLIATRWRLAFSDPVFQAHARHPRIVEYMVALLGPNIKLHQDQLFMWRPFATRR